MICKQLDAALSQAGELPMVSLDASQSKEDVASSLEALLPAEDADVQAAAIPWLQVASILLQLVKTLA